MRRKSSSIVRSSRSEPGVDVLADVLRRVRLESRVQARYELTAPWGMQIERSPAPLFFAVTRGQCLLSQGRSDLPLAIGDFVFIPADRRFAFRDARSTKPVPIETLYAARGPIRCGGVLRYGGGGEATTLLGGRFTFESEALSPLVRQLPDFLHVRAGEGEATQWLTSTLHFVAAEIETKAPGYDTIVSRLADVLFVQALRAHMESEATGWLKALVDPRIGRALQRIHERPEEAWTLARLARAAGMSRSAFAERFTSLVEEAPLAYVTRWRMHRATEMIRADASFAAIARDVGYGTESAFGKAFKRHVGITPGAYRRKLASS